MKTVQTVVCRPVIVRSNTSLVAKSDKWLQIRDAESGEILHTGQPKYIRKVARKRYNVKLAR